MKLLSKFFTKTPSMQNSFEEGDIFYVSLKDQYHIFKLLRHDKVNEIYHVLIYEPTNHVPKIDEIRELNINCYHSPIDSNGFENPQLLTKSTLSDSDLEGYRTYIIQINDIDEIVRLAQQYYKEADSLTTIKKQEEAIQKYTLAMELIPNFYEAIDNRAFCKMDLGHWEEAILDFKQSLSVNPQSVTAEFSIGECYLKLKNKKMAIQQFEKALLVDPNDKLSKDFLLKAQAL